MDQQAALEVEASELPRFVRVLLVDPAALPGQVSHTTARAHGSRGVLNILQAIEDDRAELVDSDFLDLELAQGPDPERVRRIRTILDLAVQKIPLSDAVARRAAALSSFQLRGLDALHVASAEAGNADLLITTDDRMIRRAGRVTPALRVKVVNPVEAVIAMDPTDEA